VGWYHENSGVETHAVRGKRANGWGLHDVHGNVLEWCEDVWANHYEAGDVVDPAGPAEGVGRVIRGGSWDSLAGSCRSAYRDCRHPAERHACLGFRLAAGQPG
jgi:formylglycine-generating enzyme